jgi:hypothetical protein
MRDMPAPNTSTRSGRKLPVSGGEATVMSTCVMGREPSLGLAEAVSPKALKVIRSAPAGWMVISAPASP